MNKESNKHKPLTNKQYNKLIGMHPLTDLTLHTGCRINEVSKLISSYELGVEYVDITPTKRIWINNVAAKALQTIRQDAKALQTIIKNDSLVGKSLKTYARKYAAISEKVGFKFTSRDLRATFATRLWMGGASLTVIQTLMNHSDVGQTAQYIKYAGLVVEGAFNPFDEFETLEGMTLEQLRVVLIEQRRRLIRLEEEIKKLEGGKDA